MSGRTRNTSGRILPVVSDPPSRAPDGPLRIRISGNIPIAVRYWEGGSARSWNLDAETFGMHLLKHLTRALPRNPLDFHQTGREPHREELLQLITHRSYACQISVCVLRKHFLEPFLSSVSGESFFDQSEAMFDHECLLVMWMKDASRNITIMCPRRSTKNLTPPSTFPIC